MPGPQPSWQRDACPPWCVREHGESDPVRDRYHQSEPSVLTVSISADPTEPRGAAFETVDLLVRVGRYVDELAEWVAVEPVALTVPRLALTAESALRLAERIQEQLAALAERG